MYQNSGSDLIPFGGHLKPDNRWVVLARLISWHEFESKYTLQFSESQGAPSFSFRVALGSLIIKEGMNLSDEDTVQAIEEGPYLQYFLGF